MIPGMGGGGVSASSSAASGATGGSQQGAIATGDFVFKSASAIDSAFPSWIVPVAAIAAVGLILWRVTRK